MNLWPSEKTDAMFDTILEISDACFTGVQRPPTLTLRWNYDNNIVFVHHHVNIVVGFAIVQIRNGNFYLWSIGVKPEARGVGIGSKLLREVEECARNEHVDYIELTCKVDNPAQKLYFDKGYRVQRLERKFYGVEGDGLVMRRTL
jgi:ribosomal protein S18 acetylase RimI-like enzyme